MDRVSPDSSGAAAAPDAHDISREELERRLRDPSLIIVDVLPEAAYAAAHIPGAISLPLAELAQRAPAALPRRDAEIAVYCASFSWTAGAQAVDLLHGLGYSNVRHYHGGFADWQTASLPVESASGLDREPALAAAGRASAAAPASVTRVAPRVVSARERWENAALAVVERLSAAQLFGLWVAIILVCGVAYWLSDLMSHPGLLEEGAPIARTLRGLAVAIYFSAVTATSVGYGDVLPVGAIRVLAVGEAVAGLMVFGLLIARFVSRRQDELVREIHAVTFEERLDRVQTNLHLVLSELQTIADLCDSGATRPERLGPRLESATLVFAGELRAIHDLLYNPQRAPAEALLGAILASLASALRMLREVLVILPGGFEPSSTLRGALRNISALAEDICAQCVPQVYAPALTMLMDRIQETARSIA